MQRALYNFKISLQIRTFLEIKTLNQKKKKFRSLRLKKHAFNADRITQDFQNWMNICITKCTPVQKLAPRCRKIGQRGRRGALEVDNTQRVQIWQHIAKWLPQIAKRLPMAVQNQRNHPREQPAGLYANPWGPRVPQWVTLKSFLTSVCKQILVTSTSRVQRNKDCMV